MTDGVMKRVDLVGLHVEAMSGTPLVILREQEAPHRVLPIFIGGAEATSIGIGLSGHPPPRPLSHDLMAALVEALHARVDAVHVTGLREGAFLAELAVTGPDGPRRLDARPSDGVALAVRVGAPLYASADVLDEAGSVLPDRPDEEAIERAVAEFRGHLERLDAETLSAALEEPEHPEPGSTPEQEPPSDPDDDPPREGPSS
ncbi:bifunctional nuclease family protein [Actinomycetospora cinnamomea]|uniref:BFN domain-containing protein n=1 Tax=Actinomycetospora cinnamomea TaxID=663609 RepID=A0A2U1FIE9_9PSEU|nr:bifunctional nuclease family protein [Actinomycetospora cinnamomea]PVZ11937.1 hypothetical protein C8D89_103267 [Actinomycetospora cinnamomea]